MSETSATTRPVYLDLLLQPASEGIVLPPVKGPEEVKQVRKFISCSHCQSWVNKNAGFWWSAQEWTTNHKPGQEVESTLDNEYYNLNFRFRPNVLLRQPQVRRGRPASRPGSEASEVEVEAWRPGRSRDGGSEGGTRGRYKIQLAFIQLCHCTA